MREHKHNFKILWKSQPELDRPLTQLLFCTDCEQKFWGFSGVPGKPEFMHPVKTDNYKKYLFSTNVGL